MTTPKRSLSPSDESESQPDPKRVRVDNVETTPVEVIEELIKEEEAQAIKSLLPTQHSSARAGLQRSIAMVLKHDGFDSASPEAMESFTELVETCKGTRRRGHLDIILT